MQAINWEIPEVVDLGTLCHSRSYQFVLRIAVPEVCTARSLISSLAIDTSSIGPGSAELILSLTADTIPAGTHIYGQVTLDGSEQRSFYVIAEVKRDSAARPGGRHVVWSPASWGISPSHCAASTPFESEFGEIFRTEWSATDYSASRSIDRAVADTRNPTLGVAPIVDDAAQVRSPGVGRSVLWSPVFAVVVAIAIATATIWSTERSVAVTRRLTDACSDIVLAAAAGDETLTLNRYDCWVGNEGISSAQLNRALREHALGLISKSDPDLAPAIAVADLAIAAECFRVAARGGDLDSSRLFAESLAMHAMRFPPDQQVAAAAMWKRCSLAYNAASDVLARAGYKKEASACQDNARVAEGHALRLLDAFGRATSSKGEP